MHSNAYVVYWCLISRPFGINQTSMPWLFLPNTDNWTHSTSEWVLLLVRNCPSRYSVANARCKKLFDFVYSAMMPPSAFSGITPGRRKLQCWRWSLEEIMKPLTTCRSCCMEAGWLQISITWAMLVWFSLEVSELVACLAFTRGGITTEVSGSSLRVPCHQCLPLICWCFPSGHFEHPPYNEDTKRSCYHVRNLEVFRLKQVFVLFCLCAIYSTSEPALTSLPYSSRNLWTSCCPTTGPAIFITMATCAGFCGRSNTSVRKWSHPLLGVPLQKKSCTRLSPPIGLLLTCMSSLLPNSITRCVRLSGSGILSSMAYHLCIHRVCSAVYLAGFWGKPWQENNQVSLAW